MNPNKKLQKLKNKVNKFSEKTIEEIYEICENLDYKNSSTFSYNVDRLKEFTKQINDFQIEN